MKELNVAIIGYKFMGRAHSNAWQNITNFFDVPYKPVLKVACGRNEADLQEFADRWEPGFSAVWPLFLTGSAPYTFSVL